MLRRLSLVCLVALFTAAAAAAEPLIWVEGEQAVKKQLVANAGLNNVNPDELSGGKWICSFSHVKEPAGTAEYALEIPEAGRYHLWVRAVGGTGLAYRLDGAKDAVDVAINKGQDEISVSADGNPCYPGRIAWYDVGTRGIGRGQTRHHLVPGRAEGKGPLGRHGLLRAHHGQVRAQWQVQAGREIAAADARFPAGPGVGLRARGRTSSTLPPCSICATSMRSTPASTVSSASSPDGNSFVRGDGQPIRFWAASPVRPPELDLAAQKHAAQFLAKRGVNFIRVWCNSLIPDGRGIEDHRRG